ncbi:sigma-70 family RNA polymerase sigma factor [Clostridium sp. P21]|uniref:Sigma-70 family RNA polymerase sigma factor n=1 Tax=Clostridium muellerianum TaxID=2716538 RepID=A0A7Y0HNT6_9CLOT|nr:sigma-70 family RNA polymerase sigma factor [Clostridium muellerianum]NMM62356.1 sigma-70 family RNA polymerase sigma factor [Clostridium muellerianum]
MISEEIKDLYSKVEGMLWNYTTLKNEVKNLELDIEELENDYRGCGSIVYGEKTGPTNAFNSSVENEVEYRSKELKFLMKLKRSKEIQVEKVDNALESLSDDEKKVIELKYFGNNKKLGWLKIGEIMGFCDVTCRALKNAAIKKMILIIFPYKEF